ncbi:MAG: uroporphyrinogen decarboxylase family protein [Candidatus Hydrothermarchaeales archaeon]
MIVLESIFGKVTDRVPVAPLINLGHSSKLSGIKPLEYLLDSERYAQAQIHAREYYGYDWVWAHQFFGAVTGKEREGVEFSSDHAILTLELGVKYKVFPQGQPQLVKSAVSSSKELKELKIPVPDEERMSPIRLMQEEDFVCGNMRCPFTLASTFLYDLESFLLAMKTDEASAYEFLDFALEYCTQYAKAQVDAGADALYVEDPAASGSVISPGDYRKFALPYEKALIDEIQVPVIFHICGDVKQILGDMIATGADCISVDEVMDIVQVHEHTAVWGNVSPALLVDGSKEEVRRASEAVVRLQDKVVLSSGCVVPANANGDNIKEMVRVANES